MRNALTNLQPGDLLLTRSRTLFGELAWLLSDEKYSHIAVIDIRDGDVYSIGYTSKGVSVQSLEIALEHTVRFAVVHTGAELEKGAVMALSSKLTPGTHYDFEAVAEMAVDVIPRIPEGKFICTTFAKKVLATLSSLDMTSLPATPTPMQFESWASTKGLDVYYSDDTSIKSTTNE